MRRAPSSRPRRRRTARRRRRTSCSRAARTRTSCARTRRAPRCSTPVAAAAAYVPPRPSSRRPSPEAALLTELLGCARGFSALSRFVAGESAARDAVVMSAPVILGYDGAGARGASAGIATVAFPIVRRRGDAGRRAARGRRSAARRCADDPAVSVSEHGPAETLAVSAPREESERERERERERKRESRCSRKTQARAQFAGIATAGEVQRQLAALLDALADDGIEAVEPSCPRLPVQSAVHAALPATQRAGRRRRAPRPRRRDRGAPMRTRHRVPPPSMGRRAPPRTCSVRRGAARSRSSGARSSFRAGLESARMQVPPHGIR